jgi:hypothetical protein
MEYLAARFYTKLRSRPGGDKPGDKPRPLSHGSIVGEGLLPKTCISEKTSRWENLTFRHSGRAFTVNPVVSLSSRINEQFLQRRWTPAQKPCRGDGYGNLCRHRTLSAGQTAIGYGAYGQKVYLGNSPLFLKNSVQVFTR